MLFQNVKDTFYKMSLILTEVNSIRNAEVILKENLFKKLRRCRQIRIGILIHENQRGY